MSEKDYEKKKKIVTLFYVILLRIFQAIGRKDRISFLVIENNYVARHNYALDGDNGM